MNGMMLRTIIERTVVVASALIFAGGLLLAVDGERFVATAAMSCGCVAGGGGGSGDVTGPASSTDNAIARFDGTGGKTLQNSGVTISDAGIIAGVPKIVCLTANAGSVTGTTSETVIGDCDISAGISTSAHIRATAVFDKSDATDNVTYRIRWGANGAGTGGTQLDNTTVAGDSVLYSCIQNLAAANSQSTLTRTACVSTTTAGFGSASVDTTSASEVVATAALVNSADSVTLKYFIVELLTPP